MFHPLRHIWLIQATHKCSINFNILDGFKEPLIWTKKLIDYRDGQMKIEIFDNEILQLYINIYNIAI